ncbi:AI-2E family transporter [Roseibium salinum]
MAVWPVDALFRQRLPHGLRWLGHLAAVIVILIVFSIFIGGLLLAARQITIKLPDYEDAIAAYATRLSNWIDFSNLMKDGGEEALSARLIDPVLSLVTLTLQSATTLAGILSLILFLVVLMLVETPALSAKLQSASGYANGKEYRDAIFSIAGRVRWYLVVRTVIGVATGALYALWSWMWDLDFVLVWGLLAVLLNYVPTVGSLVAGLLPAAFAFLQLPPWWASIYGIGLLVIEQIMGNYIDPKFQGRELSLSPLVVLIALMFWTWVWGMAGALVAVPMSLVMMIFCAKIPALQPLALFLSDCRDFDALKKATST